MERGAVVSSTLRSVGYDYQTRTLEIEFVNGRVYQYEDVPPEVYAELIEGPTKGRYFNAHIRNAFAYRQVA